MDADSVDSPAAAADAAAAATDEPFVGACRGKEGGGEGGGEGGEGEGEGEGSCTSRRSEARAREAGPGRCACAQSACVAVCASE
jgi:hypothetical protein